MATAAETYTFGAFGDELKSYLGISGTDEDAELTLWLASATEDCDNFCNWYWVDSDGEIHDETPSPHPSLIKLGIFVWVQTVRAWNLRGDSAGVKSKHTGAYKETYEGIGAVQAARSAAQGFWIPAVHNLLLIGV